MWVGPAPAGMVVGLGTDAKNRVQLVVEEYPISAGPTAVIMTSHACTAHQNKHFAGNLPAHYVNTASMCAKCLTLDLPEMMQRWT